MLRRCRTWPGVVRPAAKARGGRRDTTLRTCRREIIPAAVAQAARRPVFPIVAVAFAPSSWPSPTLPARRMAGIARLRWRRAGRHRFGVLQRLENGLGRMVQLLCNLSDGQPVTMQLTDLSIMVHRKHPFLPAAASTPHAGMCYDVSLFDADRVSLPDADHREGGVDLKESSLRTIVEIGRLYAKLHQSFAAPDQLATWLKTPNNAFNGSQPLQVIERGEIDRIWRMIYFLESGSPS
jgi:hypothetical protein